MNGTVTDNMTDVLDLPRLYASHTPGFEFRNTTEASGDPSMTVFESDQTDFCIRYSVDYLRTDDGYETFADLYFAGEGTMDPDEFDALADRCDELRVWLRDCARVARWTNEHRELLDMLVQGTGATPGTDAAPQMTATPAVAAADRAAIGCAR